MSPADENSPDTGGDDILAAEYVVGVLPAEERREVAARIERDQAFSVSNLGSALKDFEGQGIGVSYYLNKHVNKIQADYFKYEDKVSGAELDELRVQLQIIF